MLNFDVMIKTNNVLYFNLSDIHSKKKGRANLICPFF